MPYGSRYKRKSKFTKRKRKFRKKKAKRRQQLLSVSTVEKIAKKIATALDNKTKPALQSIVRYGLEPSDIQEMTRSYPVGDRLSLRGTFFHDNAVLRLADQWGPRCVAMVPDDQDDDLVKLTDNTRLGNTIYLKGVSIRGNLILPYGCRRAKVHFTFLQKKCHQYEPDEGLLPVQDIIRSPYNFNFQKDIDAAEDIHYNVIKDVVYTLSQPSGRATNNGIRMYNDVYKTINRFISIKKKMEYFDSDALADSTVANVQDFKQGPIEVRIWSDVPHLEDGNSSMLGLDQFPQFQGQLSWRYSAT